MSTNKKRGFAALTPEQHKKVSSKGGQYKGRKGFASYDENQRKLNASMAAQARWAKVKQARAESELANDVTETNEG